jgi:D-psicose/D-tagatose/L-ribulose 3-epimerase
MNEGNASTAMEQIKTAFLKLKKERPASLSRRLNLSWSNWGFGVENLKDSAARLRKAGIGFIELHGNHYGRDLGYRPNETLKILGDHNIRVAGICGMFSADNDLSSVRPMQRQAAIDYVKRELEFATVVGATYLLVVPAAVGRPQPYDDMEFHRSVETLLIVADEFVQHKISAAIEPIRSAEVSIVHTVADAKDYIRAVNHPGVRHINGDVYHMQAEEPSIARAILEAGDMLANLHLADSNRGALGDGSMDLDAILMALYLTGFNASDKFATPEPLGPGGNPYPAMYGKPDPAMLDRMVTQTARYFREREEAVLNS